MSDNVRFHSKHHARAHHTISTDGYFDSGIDPIASSSAPFLGDFWLSGGDVYTYGQYLTSVDGGQTWAGIDRYFSDPSMQEEWTSTYTTVQAHCAMWMGMHGISHQTITGKVTAYDYALGFPVHDVNTLIVSIEGVMQAPTTHYTVSAASYGANASIKFATLPSNDEIISVKNIALSSVPAGQWTVDGSNIYRSSGNVGIGVTPESGWGADSEVLELGDSAVDKGALAWNTVNPGADYLELMYQCYFDGTNYKHSTGSASPTRISQRSGQITFDYAAGGSADATFSWSNHMTIASDGNVGIGTTGPDEVLTVNSASNTAILLEEGGVGRGYIKGGGNGLYLTSATTGTDVQVYKSDGSGANVTFKDDGNVGIGTAAPTARLHAYSRGYDTYALKTTAVSGGSNIEVYEDVTNAQLLFGKNYDGLGTFKIATSGYSYFNAGNVGIGTNSPTYNLEVDGGSAQTHLRISTTGTDANEACLILSNSSKSAYNDGIVIGHGAGVTNFADLLGQTQMAIDVTNSRVGIGTIAPGYKLDVRSSGEMSSIQAQEGVLISTTGASNAYRGIGPHANAIELLAVREDGVLQLGTQNSGGLSGVDVRCNNSGSLMYVASAGNVGIGTTTPNHELTVVGDISATGTIHGGASKYSTGWVTSVASTTVADGATLTVPHALGTADVIVQVYANSSASDSGSQMVINQEWPGSSGFFYGAYVQSPSTTNVVVQLAAQGYTTGSSSGNSPATTSWTGDYIKVVVMG